MYLDSGEKILCQKGPYLLHRISGQPANAETLRQFWSRAAVDKLSGNSAWLAVLSLDHRGVNDRNVICHFIYSAYVYVARIADFQRVGPIPAYLRD